MAATRKKQRNTRQSTLSSAYRFEPIAVENLGVFSSTTLNFISELGRRICVHIGDAREMSYLFQRISIMLQRFNSVQDTLPVDLPDLHLILAFIVFNPGDLYCLGYKIIIIIILLLLLRALTWDATVVCPLAESYVHTAAHDEVAVAEFAAARKTAKVPSKLRWKVVTYIANCGGITRPD